MGEKTDVKVLCLEKTHPVSVISFEMAAHDKRKTRESYVYKKEIEKQPSEAVCIKIDRKNDCV